MLVRRRRYAGGLALLLAVAACHPRPEPDPERLVSPSGVYSFPIEDPYAASIAGTPRRLQLELPPQVPIRDRSIVLMTPRSSSPIFFHDRALRYSLAAQSGRAPLVFIIAGNNAGHRGRFSVFLQQLLFMAGFHVVSLPSVTFPNFMVSASTTGVPGYTEQDAEDAYHAMQKILAELRAGGLDVSDVSLVGYSLGAWQSAFVAELDDRTQAIGLRRTLLINPPVSLYRSSRKMDTMLADSIPGGIPGMDAFIDRLLISVGALYSQSPRVSLTEDFLFKAVLKGPFTRQDLRALVALAFRLAAANIAFSADVISHSGYLISPDKELRVSTSLTPYLHEALQRGFIEYFEHLLLPYYQRRDPSLTREAMIRKSSLESIAGFLKNSDKVYLITNADDFIMAPGDLDILKELFQGRETIFANGGHMGNLQEPHVAAAVVRDLLPEQPTTEASR